MSDSYDVITLHERISNCCDTFSALTVFHISTINRNEFEKLGLITRAEGQPLKSAAGETYLGAGDGGTLQRPFFNYPKSALHCLFARFFYTDASTCPSRYPSSSITTSERIDGVRRCRRRCLRCGGLCGLGARA